MKGFNNKGLVRTLKKQGMVLAVVSMTMGLSSCEEESDVCSDAFLQDYASMQAEFKKLYSENAGASELESFRSSLDKFISQHEGVECLRKPCLPPAVALDGGQVERLAEHANVAQASGENYKRRHIHIFLSFLMTLCSVCIRSLSATPLQPEQQPHKHNKIEVIPTSKNQEWS